MWCYRRSTSKRCMYIVYVCLCTHYTYGGDIVSFALLSREIDIISPQHYLGIHPTYPLSIYKYVQYYISNSQSLCLIHPVISTTCSTMHILTKRLGSWCLQPSTRCARTTATALSRGPRHLPKQLYNRTAFQKPPSHRSNRAEHARLGD